MKRTREDGDKDTETAAKQSKSAPVDDPGLVPAEEPLDLDIDIDAQLAADDDDGEFYVTVRLKDGADIIVRPSSACALVYETIAAALLKEAGLIKVLQGGEPVEFGTAFDHNGIEHKATLSVLDNEEAMIALEKLKKLGFRVCTYTEISQYDRGDQQLSLPDGERYSLPLSPSKCSLSLSLACCCGMTHH